MRKVELIVEGYTMLNRRAQRSIILCLVGMCLFLIQPATPSIAQGSLLPGISISSLKWSPDGKNLLTGHFNGAVRIYKVQTGEITFKYDVSMDAVTRVAWSHSGNQIAFGKSDGTVRVKSLLDSSSLIFTVDQSITGLSWSTDDHYLIVGTGEVETFTVWDVKTGKQFIKLDGLGVVGPMRMSPDGKRIAIATYVGLTLIDADTFALLTIWRISGVPDATGRGGVETAVAWSPKGDLLATGELDGRILLWDATSGEIIRVLGHKDRIAVGEYTSKIQNVQFSKDGKFLIGVCADGTIQTWDVRSGDLVVTTRSEEPISAADWSEDGLYLAYGLNTSARSKPEGDVDLYKVLLATDFPQK